MTRMLSLDVEAFATWAFVEELPKQLVASLSPTPSAGARDHAFGMLGGMIDDDSSREPGFPGMLGPPHVDALTFRQVWQAIDQAAGEWIPELAELLADRPQCIPVAEARRVIDPDDDRTRAVSELRGWYEAELRVVPSAIVKSFAIRKARPEWHPDTPSWDYVRRNGNPKWFVQVDRMQPSRYEGGKVVARRKVTTEEEGYDFKRKRPRHGAYRKTIWSPDPFMVARDRAEYVIWWRALRLIAESLAAECVLRNHLVTGPSIPEMPWKEVRHPGQEKALPERRILRDLSTMSAAQVKQYGRRRRQLKGQS